MTNHGPFVKTDTPIFPTNDWTYRIKVLPKMSITINASKVLNDQSGVRRFELEKLNKYYAGAIAESIDAQLIALGWKP
jgi:hypothetical protein